MAPVHGDVLLGGGDEGGRVPLSVAPEDVLSTHPGQTVTFHMYVYVPLMVVQVCLFKNTSYNFIKSRKWYVRCS